MKKLKLKKLKLKKLKLDLGSAESQLLVVVVRSGNCLILMSRSQNIEYKIKPGWSEQISGKGPSPHMCSALLPPRVAV